MDVEVAAPLARKEKRRASAVFDPIEGIEGARLQRHSSHARLRLRMLELALGEGATDVDDALVAIDVALLECDPFRWPQPGRRREQDHRPVPWPDRGSESFELRPRLERVLLPPASRRVVDADLRGI